MRWRQDWSFPWLIRSELRHGLWLLLCLLPTALCAATVRDVLAEFESGATSSAHSTADLKIGRSKEVSRFQILPLVWRQYSKSRQYTNPEIAWTVAERILQDRHGDFRRSTGRDWNYRELYLMW